MTSEKIQWSIDPSNLDTFTSKLEDLSKISDTIKLKIDNENILMYSMVGETILLAFKNYLVDTKDYFKFNKELEFTLDIVISGAKKFVKNLSFIKKSEKIIMESTYRKIGDGSVVESTFIQIKNGKFKISLNNGESSEIRDIPKDALIKRLDTSNRNWHFSIERSDFNDIKKLSSINSEGKVIHLSIDSSKVSLYESSVWELQVDEVEYENKHLMFNKSYLPNINDGQDKVEFHIFDTFILTKDSDSHLMISFEQDFSD